MRNMEYIPREDPVEYMIEKPGTSESNKSSRLKEIALAAAAFAGIGSVPAYSQEVVSEPTEQAIPATNIVALEQVPVANENSLENRNLGEHFNREQLTYTTLYRDLSNRQVMFVDDRGLLIGGAVAIEPIVTGDAGVALPGSLDQRGVPIGRLSQNWLNAARTRVCIENNTTCNLSQSEPRVRSVVRLVRDATPYFSEGAASPETFFDIIRHMGSRPVPGAEGGVTYIQYIREHFGEASSLSPSVVNELRDIIPGLAAQESQYNPAALSPVGARSIFQIMPETWRSMGYSRATEGDFRLQVQAAGRYFETAHRELTTRNVEDFRHITETFFGGDEQAFEKYFLVPALVNTYNSGTGRVSRVITWFTRQHSTRESINSISSGQGGYGYDVYAAMAHFASINNTPETSGYREHSSEYFSRAFALANIIRESESELQTATTIPAATTETTATSSQ